jgi:hypothetical protein
MSNGIKVSPTGSSIDPNTFKNRPGKIKMDKKLIHQMQCGTPYANWDTKKNFANWFAASVISLCGPDVIRHIFMFLFKLILPKKSRLFLVEKNHNTISEIIDEIKAWDYKTNNSIRNITTLDVIDNIHESSQCIEWRKKYGFLVNPYDAKIVILIGDVANAPAYIAGKYGNNIGHGDLDFSCKISSAEGTIIKYFSKEVCLHKLSITNLVSVARDPAYIRESSLKRIFNKICDNYNPYYLWASFYKGSETQASDPMLAVQLHCFSKDVYGNKLPRFIHGGSKKVKKDDCYPESIIMNPEQLLSEYRRCVRAPVSLNSEKEKESNGNFGERNTQQVGN